MQCSKAFRPRENRGWDEPLATQNKNVLDLSPLVPLLPLGAENGSETHRRRAILDHWWVVMVRFLQVCFHLCNISLPTGSFWGLEKYVMSPLFVIAILLCLPLGKVNGHPPLQNVLATPEASYTPGKLGNSPDESKTRMKEIPGSLKKSMKKSILRGILYNSRTPPVAGGKSLNRTHCLGKAESLPAYDRKMGGKIPF